MTHTNPTIRGGEVISETDSTLDHHNVDPYDEVVPDEFQSDRESLKIAFPETEFGFSNEYNPVITWTDGPTEPMVTARVDKRYHLNRKHSTEWVNTAGTMLESATRQEASNKDVLHVLAESDSVEMMHLVIKAEHQHHGEPPSPTCEHFTPIGYDAPPAGVDFRYEAIRKAALRRRSRRAKALAKMGFWTSYRTTHTDSGLPVYEIVAEVNPDPFYVISESGKTLCPRAKKVKLDGYEEFDFYLHRPYAGEGKFYDEDWVVSTKWGERIHHGATKAGTLEYAAYKMSNACQDALREILIERQNPPAMVEKPKK